MANNVPLSTDVPKIYVPSLSAKRIYVPQIQAKHLPTPFKAQTTTNKIKQAERRHAKDLGDIILGHPLYGTRQLRETLEDNNADWAVYVPILNRIVGVGAMTKERFLKPISEGKTGTAILNTVESLGSSLDILANPVKSLMPWAGGGDSMDLFKAMGWLENSYRETYQWNTGHFLVDFIGEVISDPTNWITLGGKAVLDLTDLTDDMYKATDKALRKFIPGSKRMLKTIPNELKTRVIVDAANELSDPNGQTVRHIMKYLTTKKNSAMIQMNKFTKNSVKHKEAKTLFYMYSRMTQYDKYDALEKALAELRLSKEFKWYNTIHKAMNVSRSVDRAVMTATEVVLPHLGLSHVFIKYGAKPMYNYLHNKVINELKDYSIEQIAKSPMTAARNIKSTIGIHDNLLNKANYLRVSKMLESKGTSISDIQDLCIKLYEDTPITKQNNLEELRAKLVDCLIKKVPELEALKPYLLSDIMANDMDENLVKILKGFEITLTDLRQLLDNLVQRTSVMVSVDVLVPKVYKNAVDADFEQFKNKHMNSFKLIREALKEAQAGARLDAASNTELLTTLDLQLNKDLEAIINIKYLDEELLRIPKQRSGLYYIKNYIKFMREQNPEQLMLTSALLDYYGINVNNAGYVRSMYQSILALAEELRLAVVKMDLKSIKLYQNLIAIDYENLLNVLNTNKKGIFVSLDTLDKSATTSKHLFKSGDSKLYKDMRRNPMRKKYEQFISDPKNNALKEYLDKAPAKDVDAYIRMRYKFFEAFGIDKALLDDYTDLIKAIQRTADEGDKVFLGTQVDELDYKLVKNRTRKLKRWLYNYNKEEVPDIMQRTVYNPRNFKILHNPLSEGANSEHAYKFVYDNATKDARNWLARSKIGDTDFNKLFDDILLTDPDKAKDLSIFELAERMDLMIEFKEDTLAKYKVDGVPSLLRFRDDIELEYNLVPKYKELYGDLNDLRQNIMDKYTSFATVMNSIHIVPGFQEYYDQLSLPDSLTRSSLYAAISYMSNSTDDTLRRTAIYLRELLSRVDCSNVLENLTSMITLPSYLISYVNYTELTDVIEQMLRDEFFSVIYYYRKKGTADMVEHIDTLTSRFFSNYYRNIKSAVKELFNSPDVKAIPLDMTVEDIIKQSEIYLKETIGLAFRQYGDAMLEISRTAGLDLPFMYVLDQRSLNIAKQLKQNYDIILKAMHGEPYKQQTVSDLIQKFAGDVAHSTTKKIKKLYDEGTDLYLDISTDSKYLGTFETALHNAYNEIYANNRRYSDSFKKIGRTSYNKGMAIKVYEDIRYFSVDALNRFAYANVFEDNIYALALATGVAAKAVNPKELLTGLLNLKLFKPEITDNEYQLLVRAFRHSQIKIDAYKNIDPNRAKIYSDNLRKFFAEHEISWAPANPDIYFMELDDTELYVWNDVVRNRSLNANVDDYVQNVERSMKMYFVQNKQPILSYTFDLDELQYNLDYASNPMLFYNDLETLSNDFTTLHRDGVFGPMSVTTATHQLNELYDCVEETLHRRIKDPKSLQQYQQVYTTHQKRGVDYIVNLRKLVPLERDTRLIKEAIKDKYALSVLRANGVDPDHTMNSKRFLNFLTTETHEMFKQEFLELKPKQLRKYLEDYTFEGKAIYIDEHTMETPFKNIKELNEAGVGVVSDIDHPGIWLLYTLDGDYETEKIVWKVRKSVVPEVKRTITDIIKKNRQAYTWGDINIPYELYDGIVLYRKQYDTIMKSELFNKLSQKALHFSPVLGLNNSIKNSIGLPNFTIIGSANAYMNALDLAKDVFKHSKIYPMYYSKALTRRVSHGLLDAIHTQDQKIKYLSMFLNEDYSLGSPLFRRVFHNASDEDIENIFSRNNFVAAVVKETKDGQPKIYKINIANQRQLADAIEAKAIVLPHEVYRNMVLTLNDYKFDNKFMQIYERTIMFAYKTIYLSHVGTLMRNYIDSSVIKPGLTTDGLSSVLDHFKYQHQATRLLEWYNQIHTEVFDITKDTTFNRRALAKVLEQHSAEEKYWYAIVDTFINSSASGGNSEAMMAFWKKYNIDRAGYTGFAWEKYLADTVGESPRVLWVQNANNHIEQSARLGMLLYELDHGYNIPEAIRDIISTHFDYALKDDVGYLMERLFWFSTFSINNLMYYVNMGLTKNPDILDAYLDALDLSWNDGKDYTWDEVKENNYLAYWAMLGHMRWSPKWLDDKDIIFKTGSSFMDFFSLIFGINSELKERLNPFLSVLLGFEPINNLNPWAADVSYGKQLVQGRSLVPSVYTTINRYKDYKKKHYIERKPYTGGGRWTTYPRKLPKIRHKPVKSRFAYTRNWRQYTRYFHRKYDVPQWTYRNSRQFHRANRYITNQKIRT